MKYTLHWLEFSSDPDMSLYPIGSKITGSYFGGTQEIECFDSFEADNTERAKEYISENYDCEIWSCDDEAGNKFTEED